LAAAANHRPVCDPDLVFFNAGVDPHEADRLGRLSLTDDGLKERDRRVCFRSSRTRDIPIAAVIGGGYSQDINALARRHLANLRGSG
jgi:acetoin utilization deacetylase AcuC-like enzyme